MTNEEFKQFVSDALSTGLDINLIADTVEVAPATIRRWANGTVHPRGGIIDSIVREINSLKVK